MNNSPSVQNQKKIIILKCSRSIEFIEIRKIIYVESLRAYCKLHMKENSLVFSYPLKHIDEKLKDFEYFFRCHKSYLINMQYVKSYHVDKGIKLENDVYVPLAISMKSVFLEKMEVLFGNI